MEWVIALMLVAPAAVLASKRSSYLIDYAVFIFVLNRGIRRIVDYYINGYFNPLSPISLVPLIVALLMGLVVFTNQNSLPKYVKGIAGLFIGAFALAGTLGFISTQFAVLYAGAEVVAPLFLMLYAILLNPPMDVRDRWIRSFAWGAILVSAYGWYQYLVIPPWDAFWLKATKMTGYMGIPEPTKMTVFSTMGERGVVAGFLGYSVVPMIVSPKWRTKLGWLGVLLVFSVILLTLSRGGIIIATVATAAFLIVNKGAKVGQVIVAAVVLSVGAFYGISKIPNSERIVERYQKSIEERDKDGSYSGRIEIMQGSVGLILSNPLGYGLGAVGLATRINTGETKSAAKVVDAGYFDILLTYGIPGTILMLMAVWKIWIQLKLRYKNPAYRTDHVLVARALMLSLVVTCFVGNFLNQFSVLWLAMGTGLAIRAAGPLARNGLRVAGNGRRAGALLAAGHAAAREELARQAVPPSPGAGLRRDEGGEETKSGMV
jgi:putative inorganic carbon (HCO3(-)) transporter